MLNNIKHVSDFISSEEKELILKYISSLQNISSMVDNNHIKTILDKINGQSYIFDLSNTNISIFLSTFQSSGNVLDKSLPSVFYEILERISDKIKIEPTNVFLQIIVMEKGGQISPHYDTAYDGVINYKCNISVVSDCYDFYIDKDILNIEEGDLYCFEASLYKHWTNSFNNRRVLLSYGFGVPYHVLGRTINDPRVRLSNRILKYIQK
jgi:hypothetical protein